MTDKKGKLLQTQGRGREVAPATGKSGGALSLHELEAGKLKLDDRSYVLKFGKPEDFARVREVIEDRRKRLPAFSYWKCENPACLWKAKMNGEKTEGGCCLKCNIQNFKDGSFMKRMDAKEAAQFEADEAERARREIEQLGRIQLGGINEGRVKMGLAAMSWEEFKAAEKAELERRAQLSKVKA